MTLKKSPAWKVFASWIKRRDKNRCFTCGKLCVGRDSQAGHFIQAYGHGNTFFDEKNVHCQCSRCNIWLYGNLLVYRRKIIEKYGEGYDLILEKRGTTKKWDKKELKEIKEKYGKRIKLDRMRETP